jgi:hypothetical protein
MDLPEKKQVAHSDGERRAVDDNAHARQCEVAGHPLIRGISGVPCAAIAHTINA